jgi:hypothetical protein
VCGCHGGWNACRRGLGGRLCGQLGVGHGTGSGRGPGWSLRAVMGVVVLMGGFISAIRVGRLVPGGGGVIHCASCMRQT